MIPVWVCAQNITVKGTVKDTSGESMPGVNVLQVGTTNGFLFSAKLPGNFAFLSAKTYLYNR